MCNMPRRTRASGVVVGYDRDAGDATVFECGFRDHRDFLGGLMVSGKAGQENFKRKSQVKFKRVVNVSGQTGQVTRLGPKLWYDVAVRPK